MSRFDQFLEAYRQIEDGLRKTTGLFDGGVSFSKLMDSARQKSRVVDRNYAFMRTVHELRNVLIHRGQRGATLAEPTETVVRESEAIANALTRPPPLPKEVFHPVRVFPAGSPLGEALRFIRQNDFSQVPVVNDDKFESLLTTNSIARWLAKSVDEEIVEIKEKPLSEVLQAREDVSEHRFCSSKVDCETVIALFDEARERGELLQAVLLTDNGKPGAVIRGIVTPHDLGRLYATLTLAV